MVRIKNSFAHATRFELWNQSLISLINSLPEKESIKVIEALVEIGGE